MGLKILNGDKSLTNKKIIAIGSGKGGVGKSSITVSLAHTFKALGKQVGILDADIFGPSLKIMMPTQTPISEKEGWIIPGRSHGIEVMSIGYFNGNRQSPAMRAPIVNAMIKEFLSKVKWGDLDILLIDLPPGTGDIHLTLTQSIALDGAVVITTPQRVAISDVKKSLEFFQKMNISILGLVENMSYFLDPISQEKHFLFGSGGGEHLSDSFQIPILGKIPLEEDLCNQLDNGKSIFEGRGTSKAREVLLEIGIEILRKVCDHSGWKKKNVAFTRDNANQISIYFDQEARTYMFSDLQKNCPCARCVDSATGIAIVDVEAIEENVSVTHVEEVGNYGLKFHFTSGCKQGIFTWDHFKKIKI